MVAKYKRIQAEKKAEEKAIRDAKRIAKQKAERRNATLAKFAAKRKEKRKIIMYETHLRRERMAMKKRNTKMRRKRINHRYYIRHHKRPYIRRRLHKGDELGRFMIYFTKNKEYYRTYGWYHWKFGSMEKYNKLVSENHENTICPVLYEGRRKKSGEEPVRYEILIKKKIDPEVESNESVFRDDMGASITVKTDDPHWKILSKNEWYFEETFYLFGYHPKYDRKTAKFIIDNVIMKYVEEYTMCRIFIWKSYLFIENDDDFTFLLTKDSSESIRLYNILYDRLSGIKNLYFTGDLSRGSVQTWVDKMIEKTGWEEGMIRRCTPIVS